MKWNHLVKKQPLKGKFAIITGGSQGIGKETSKHLAQLGCNIHIIARNIENLKKAKNEIELLLSDLSDNQNQFVHITSCDCADYENVKKVFNLILESDGVPDYLINCVGTAFPDYIQNLDYNLFKKNMDINYFGVLNPILAVLPSLMERKKGHVSAISSGLGFFGMMGYATYAPTKFAIVGLIESLRNELSPYNISFSILYPADTKTPGFDKENLSKPPECAKMSENGKISSPEDIAKYYIKSILQNKFNIFPNSIKIFWNLKRLFPRLTFRILDILLIKARKSVGKSKSC